MNVEVVGKFLSTLPEDDDHPYRTGPWRPQTTEWDADDLTVVDGRAPARSRRRLPAQHREPAAPRAEGLPPVRRRRHDARRRLPRRKGVLPQQVRPHRRLRRGERGGRPAVAGHRRAGRAGQARLRLGRKDVDEGRVEHRRDRAPRHRADQLLPVRRPVPRRPVHRRHPRQAGVERRVSRIDWGVSAHPKVDDKTGELLFFNYCKQAPFMHYGVVDANNELVHYVDVPLPGPRLPHDMAFTENYAILNDFPLFWEPEYLERNAHVAALPPRHAVPVRRHPPARPDLADPVVRGRPDLRPALHQRLRGRRRDRARRVLPRRPGAGRQRPRRQVAARLPLPRPGPHAGPTAPLAVQPASPAACARSNCRTASPSSA